MTLRALALLLPASALTSVLCAASGAPPARPIDVHLGGPALAEAVRLGVSGDEPALEGFHARYRASLGGPLPGSLEIVSEYRRAVLSAQKARRGGGTWDAAQAARALEPFRGLVTVVVNVHFNPKNTYRSLPQFDLVLYPQDGGPRLEPVDQQATPSYLSGPAPPGTPILEGTVEAQFRAASLDPGGKHLVGIFFEGREIERIPVDFASMR